MPEKKIALLDIDGTLFDGFIAKPLTEKLEDSRLVLPGTYNQLLSLMNEYSNGNMSYEIFADKLLLNWANGLSESSIDQVKQATEDFITNTKEFFSFTRPLLKLLEKSHDAYFVTGEPDFVVEAVQHQLGGAGYISSVFETINERFSGQVERPLATSMDKYNALSTLISQKNMTGSIGMADSDSDIAMLKVVEHVFCIKPKPALRAEARKNRWSIMNKAEKSLLPRIHNLVSTT